MNILNWSVLFRVSWIQDIVVVVATENVDQMSDIVQRFGHRKVRVVTGGSTRHRSICKGVQALAGDPPEVVIVHDAVRPFVEEDFLSQIALAAKEHGVSAPRDTPAQDPLGRKLISLAHQSLAHFFSLFS